MSFRKVAVAVAAATSIAILPAAAQAAGSPKVSVSPKTVQAGGTLTVQVTRTHGRRCVLSWRADRRGALVQYKRRLTAKRTVLRVPGGARAGRRVAVARCGSRTTAVRFTITAAPVAPTPVPAPPAPDEQGFVAGDTGAQAGEPSTEQQFGAGDYPNARIADIALSKLGQNLYTPGPLDHGQCKQAVNDWVAEASGRTQVMGGDYYNNYARNGGIQVPRDQAVKGDIIQLDKPADTRNYYRGMHTAVVVGHAAGANAFDVVDSNFQLDTTVRRHAWDPYASAAKYGLRVTIWRMGSVDAAPTPPPAATPAPGPAPALPPQTWAETTGGNTNTWTNWNNAGGTQGPTIPRNATVQIACKLTGFRVADGNTWWYRIASSPWNGTFYASADAFYNNGRTSGSLVGTPFVDPAVRNC